MDTSTVECGECGAALESVITPNASQIPCPKCGSLKQHVKMTSSDDFTLTLRDSLKGKVKDATFHSKKRIRREFFYGSVQHKSAGDYVYKEREIDGDQNRYRELVREETGEVIRDVDEALSNHTGHGSDKFAPKSADQVKNSEHPHDPGEQDS